MALKQKRFEREFDAKAQIAADFRHCKAFSLLALVLWLA